MIHDEKYSKLKEELNFIVKIFVSLKQMRFFWCRNYFSILYRTVKLLFMYKNIFVYKLNNFLNILNISSLTEPEKCMFQIYLFNSNNNAN